MEDQKSQLIKRTQQLLDTINDGDEAYQYRELRDFNRMKFETDEDFDGHLLDIKSHLSSQKQSNVNNSVGTELVRRGVITDDKKQASEQLIKDVLDKIM